MNKTKHNFSENSREIRNHLVVDEDRYPFLKTLRMFLEKVNTISACYLSGPIVHKGSIDLKYEPIIHLYIISDKLTSYVYSFIKNKAKTLIEDHFFPNYILIEVYFNSIHSLDSSTKFCLQCDSAFWFGDRAIHETHVPTYCMEDICDCNNNYQCCADRLRNHMNQSVNGKTLWINIYILLNIAIKAIYEKNCCILDTYHCTCEEKYNAITNHPDIHIVDKNIVTESFRIIKNVNSHLGATITINKPFFNFICNYLDLCNKKKPFQELLEEDFSDYRNWLQFITVGENTDASLEPEDRNDFNFLFKQSNSKYFNRIQRDQLLMNKLVPPRPSGVNPAGLTSDIMKRLRANKK